MLVFIQGFMWIYIGSCLKANLLVLLTIIKNIIYILFITMPLINLIGVYCPTLIIIIIKMFTHDIFCSLKIIKTMIQFFVC